MTEQTRLTVELVHKSNNPKIREMFKENEVGQRIRREVNRFAKDHGLRLENEQTPSGTSSGFVLTGNRADVEEFIKTFLPEDSGRGVFYTVMFSK
jgi:hypothetical protein